MEKTAFLVSYLLLDNEEIEKNESNYRIDIKHIIIELINIFVHLPNNHFKLKPTFQR